MPPAMTELITLAPMFNPGMAYNALMAAFAAVLMVPTSTIVFFRSAAWSFFLIP